MDPSEQCPESGAWKTFLDGELLDEASADLTAHLEDCEACQQTLERLAAGKETWEGTAKQLAEADANAEQLESSGHLRDVLNDLKQGIEIDSRAASITPESLTFLAESEEEDSIGKLGNYEVLEIVGAGGMGIVMRAWDPSLRRIVAIKVLASHLANSAAAGRRFVREAQAAAAVSHDHVVAIHAVEADHEPPYLVMQYIEGKTLQQRLDGVGPLHIREVLRIGQQTALGLAAAHQQGIVHRDIKPANILLENGVERVRITDFGLARAIDDASMTQSGVVAGTPLFMAPEQAQGIQLDHRADLFSLGSVLYVMCTGRPPFRSSTMIGVIRRVCDDSPRPIREINPDVPDWLCAIIDRLLAKDPKDRYASAEEIAELLGSCLAHVQQPTVVSLPEKIISAGSTDEVLPDHDVTTKSGATATPDGTVESAPEKPASPESLPKPDVQHTATTPVTPAGIRREVFWPAAMMITAGIANFLVACVTVIYLIDHLYAGVAQHLTARILGVLPPVLIVYGSLKMMRVQSRVWGIVAAIVCLVSGPCYPLSWPASIWALAVLMRPHVQREFSRISNERRQPDAEELASDIEIPGERRPTATLGQRLARFLLLVEASIAGAVIPYSGIIAFTLEGPDWIPRRIVIAMTGLVLVIAAYVALALYRIGFESCGDDLRLNRRHTFQNKLRSPAIWSGTLAGVIPCLLIAADINATTYNDFLSGAVVPLSLIGAALLMVGAVLNLNRAQSARYEGQTVDHPAFALFEWPTPLLAILWTAFIAWSDFQGTVGYARFQLDDHSSSVTLFSHDTPTVLRKRGGWTKLRLPEGKYRWAVSDAGINNDHSASGTIEIESPRTSVVDAAVNGDSALRRSEGYWRCVSTDSVLNARIAKDRRWARPPAWLAIDEQFILTWDASSKLIGNWSLTRNATKSPKTLTIGDILTGDLLAEGQWAVSQKQLLLRLHPPRETTLPYLTSIHSKPRDGNLIEWRFEKLPGPPEFLEAKRPTPPSSEFHDEGTRPFGFGSAIEPFPKESVVSDPDASEIDGHWIVESVSIGQAVSNTDIVPAELGDLIIAGHWLLSVDPGGKISKGLVSIKEDSNPKRINFTTSLEDDSDHHGVHRGIYNFDESSLDICCVMPEVTGKDAEGNPKLFSREELDVLRRKAVSLLTVECFVEPLRDNRVIWRCRRMPNHFRTPTWTPTPNVEGIVLESRQANPTGTPLVEISIGADDGLVEGQEWSIHRRINGNGDAPEIQPLGKIRLKLVSKDRSIGIGTVQHQGTEFKKGDIVTSVPQ